MGGVSFALFCLGDRAYGDQFCAAGRKLAVRMIQLGARARCEVGYGDDGTPNGGVFADLDVWLETHLLPSLEGDLADSTDQFSQLEDPSRLYRIAAQPRDRTCRACDEWQQPEYAASHRDFMARIQPVTAYRYVESAASPWGYEREAAPGDGDGDGGGPPFQQSLLTFRVAANDRLTPEDWNQNTRHLRLELAAVGGGGADDPSATLPVAQKEDGGLLLHRAGDVAVAVPCNSDASVQRFLDVLPEPLRAMADHDLTIQFRGEDETASASSPLSSTCCPHWPRRCTLRGWLAMCADIQALPEREDLRALAPYCDAENHPRGRDQRDKLLSLAEPSEAALYADYVLREKRAWADVLHDFDSIRHPGSTLTLEALLSLLSPIRPREFSIASSPTLELNRAKKAPSSAFGLELCVAVVEGRTPLGRTYHGLCSTYLSHLEVSSLVRLWIRPGSFQGLPTEVDERTGRHRTPVLCVGAGTGIAPLRGLLLEREAVRDQVLLRCDEQTLARHDERSAFERDNLLLFGCRRQSRDYYYRQEWDRLSGSGRLCVLTAFSQDQWHKVYVQQVLRRANDESRLLVRHAVERGGAIYIAGGPKMARAVKDEIVEALAREFEADEKQAKQLLTKLQRLGHYSLEAWS